MRAAAIIVAGGRGVRMGAGVPKQFLTLGGKPVLARTLEPFFACAEVDEIVITAPEDCIAETERIAASLKPRKSVRIVPGGPERQESVRLGLEAIGDGAEIIIIHDAVRPFVTARLIAECIGGADRFGAVTVARPVKETVKAVEGGTVAETLDRSRLRIVQTPQAFRTTLIVHAHAKARADGFFGTDDSTLVERLGHPVHIVAGDDTNIKITTPADLATAEAFLPLFGGEGGPMLKIGQGYDAHRFAEGRKLVLGGVDIPWERGLLGHSDADVLAHAVGHALLGAAGLGDLGENFPDTDPALEGARSMDILAKIAGMIAERNGAIRSIDTTVVAQAPKLSPHKARMAVNIAEALGIPKELVSVKATTTEGMGFTGRGEGIEAHAVALVEMRTTKNSPQMNTENNG